MGLKQKDLAEKVSIRPHYLSLLEAGKREPSLTVLRKIARELDIPVSLLLWEAEQQPETLGPENQERWRQLRHFLIEMERLRLRDKAERRAS